MNSDAAPGKTPEEMYIEQKVRVLLMLKKMGSNLTPSEEAFLRSYSGVVNSQLSQLPQHPIDQGAEDVVMAFSRSETEDRRQWVTATKLDSTIAAEGRGQPGGGEEDSRAQTNHSPSPSLTSWTVTSQPSVCDGQASAGQVNGLTCFLFCFFCFCYWLKGTNPCNSVWLYYLFFLFSGLMGGWTVKVVCEILNTKKHLSLSSPCHTCLCFSDPSCILCIFVQGFG